ncbi:MAG: hypothetical protein KDD83_29935, partial [Caldilineaceae bacterium]|nr:hypothetical protein [Caldilineaceae bacterium]
MDGFQPGLNRARLGNDRVVSVLETTMWIRVPAGGADGAREQHSISRAPGKTAFRQPGVSFSLRKS